MTGAITLATGVNIAYVVAMVCFVLALRGLSSPKGARRGSFIGAAGMFIAIGMTFVNRPVHNVILIVIAMALGVAIGVPAARLVKMTAMPQMVAAFNGVGGGAAALVDIADFIRHGGNISSWLQVCTIFAVAVGCISFSGSVIAFMKLQEVMTGRPITYSGQQVVNGLVGLGILGVAGAVLGISSTTLLDVMGGLALLFGVAFVLPIGGADMPVVISLLNSFTGLAVAATGFVFDSLPLIIGGTLVGASGTLLTRMMSQAMGRSLGNVLFAAVGSVVSGGAGAAGAEDRPVRSAGPDDVATMLAYASKVIIVPGYGLAVAQAQHTVKELADALEKKGVSVDFAIHPVAGRMPGHMNVLLAEADVPYDQLKEMDEANSEMTSTDVALVVGANDVVNPAARNTQGSPIYGMPIIDVDRASAVVFMKRSMRPGFAGIDNELFYEPKVTMLFGDAKDSLSKLVTAVKAA